MDADQKKSRWAILALGVVAHNMFRRGLGPVLIPLGE